MPTTNPKTADPPKPPFDGGCACGHVRYRLLNRPLFVHCCHCTRCQRETGTPYAHHAMIEYTNFLVTAGEPSYVLVPTDSGGKHWVSRCPHCQTAMWNEHGTRKAITRYVRVGTLDKPDALAPLAHIFVRSKQAWVALDESTPKFRGAYDTAKIWPTESLARYAAAKQLRAQEAKIDRAVATSQRQAKIKTK